MNCSERIKEGYGPERVQALREQLVRFAQQPDGVEQSKRVLEPYLRQMNDLSIFMKKLKGCSSLSSTTDATSVTGRFGRSASRAFCWKEALLWRRLPPTSI